MSEPFRSMAGKLKLLVEESEPEREERAVELEASAGSILDAWRLADWAPVLTQTASYGRLARLVGVSREEVQEWWRVRGLNPVDERERLLAALEKGEDFEEVPGEAWAHPPVDLWSDGTY